MEDKASGRTRAVRGSLAHGSRLAGGVAARAAAEQSREKEEKRRLTCGRGREKKRN